MTRTWQGVSDGEPWRLQAEVDRFTESEPFVVSLVADHEDADGKHQTLVALSSTQARELAAVLTASASAADANNLRITPKSEPQQPGEGA